MLRLRQVGTLKLEKPPVLLRHAAQAGIGIQLRPSGFPALNSAPTPHAEDPTLASKGRTDCRTVAPLSHLRNLDRRTLISAFAAS